tara:strand:- start:327 stop:812 length:486 start_codon:yes stop_codon:yes gene_type:complete
MKHLHHIIPKHMGGTDDVANLIELTVEEHAEAHRVLYEQHGKQEDFMAWHMLKGQMGKDEALFMARSIGGKKLMSEESKAKLRASCKLKVERHRADGTLEAANKKRSESHKGKVKSKEHIENWSKARKGHTVSEETRAKIRATLVETRAKKKLAEASSLSN